MVIEPQQVSTKNVINETCGKNMSLFFQPVRTQGHLKVGGIDIVLPLISLEAMLGLKTVTSNKVLRQSSSKYMDQSFEYVYLHLIPYYVLLSSHQLLLDIKLEVILSYDVICLFTLQCFIFYVGTFSVLS